MTVLDSATPPGLDVIGERTLPMLLAEQAAQFGERAFIVHESLAGKVSELSFAGLHRQARGYAAALRARGIGPGSRVFVFLRNTPDFVPLWFGILYAGAVIVPANIYLTVHELAPLLELGDPALIVSEAMFLDLVGEAAAGAAAAPIVVTDEAAGAERLVPATEADVALPPVTSRDLAEILFTSGTSSRPKGVMLTHANLLWSGLSADDLRADDRFFNNKPLFHANCQSTVLNCLSVGATVILGERYSATRYIAQLIRHDVTVCSLSGMLCRTLLNQPPSADDARHKVRVARYAINISEDEIEGFTRRFGMRPRNGYGLSEAMLSVASEPRGGPSLYPSIGRPAIGREVFLVNDDNRPVPPGETGEIVVRGVPGRTLMLGYFRDPAASEAAFAGGWLHTGDLARADPHGNLYFVGRKKDVIKRAGENISAGEVEEVLVGHPAISDAAVIGVPDPVRDQAIKAFVVVGDAQTDEESIRDHCRAHLAYFKVPEFIVFLDELPRNASGKLMKRDLEVM